VRRLESETRRFVCPDFSDTPSACRRCAAGYNAAGSGSVAEWSIAPVLKTGNPQGFVSSNLTASAMLYF
jgi:hypothetical protein